MNILFTEIYVPIHNKRSMMTEYICSWSMLGICFSWMWGWYGCDTCHPIDCQGWFCWSGWLVGCPLSPSMLHMIPSRKGWNFSKEDPTYVTGVGITALPFKNLQISSQDRPCYVFLLSIPTYILTFTCDLSVYIGDFSLVLDEMVFAMRQNLMTKDPWIFL